MVGSDGLITAEYLTSAFVGKKVCMLLGQRSKNRQKMYSMIKPKNMALFFYYIHEGEIILSKIE